MVRMNVPEGGRVRVTVLNAVGQEVVLLLDAVLPVGERSMDLDLSRLAPGAYTVRAAREDGSFNAIRVLRIP